MYDHLNIESTVRVMNEEINNIITETKSLLDNCKSLENELKEINRGKEFLINEYNTNKDWFRSEPGEVTIEDVIKTCFEFGWASRRQFDYDREQKATTP